MYSVLCTEYGVLQMRLDGQVGYSTVGRIMPIHMAKSADLVEQRQVELRSSYILQYGVYRYVHMPCLALWQVL